MIQKRARMPTAAVADVDLYYEIEGSGDPVVLLSGLTGMGRSWAGLLPAFAAGHETIVFDQPGSGRSGLPPEFSIEHHALAVAEAVRSLGCGPVHVVGTSTGGAIAQVMALDHADVVRSITLASSWARADAFFRHQFKVRKDILLGMGEPAYAEASALLLFSPEYLRDHSDTIGRRREVADSGPPAEVMARRIDMVVAHDQLDRLGDIDKPALVLVGSHDACTPPYFSRELAARIPGAELVVLDGGHSIHTEAADEFRRHVLGFVDRH